MRPSPDIDGLPAQAAPLAPRVGTQLIRDINNAPAYRPLLLLLDSAWRASHKSEEFAELIDAARQMVLNSPSPEEFEKTSRRRREAVNRLEKAAKDMQGRTLRMQRRKIAALQKQHADDPLPLLLSMSELEKDVVFMHFSPAKLAEIRTRAIKMEKLYKKEDATTSGLHHQMLDAIIVEALRWPLGESLAPFFTWANQCKSCKDMHEFSTEKWPQWLVDAHERRRTTAATTRTVTREPELAAAM